MKKLKSWLPALLVAVLILTVLYVGFYFVYLDFLVDYWWFDSLGYGWHFLMRNFYKYLVFAGVTLFFFLVFFLNFCAASCFLGNSAPVSPKKESQRLQRSRNLARMFRTGSKRVYIPLSLVLSVFVAMPFFEKWERLLFFMFGPEAGVSDPAFGRDISFYLFSYPMYLLLEQRLLFSIGIVAAASLLLYLIERRVLARQDQPLPRGARIHLNFLAVVLAVLAGWGIFLKRYDLLYSDAHMPLFFGPGYTEMNVTLPLIWAAVICWAAAAAAIIYYINFRRHLLAAIGVVAVFAAVFAMGGTSFVHQSVEKYIVLPNELSRQAPYIKNSINATLSAYGLADAETRNMNIERIPWGTTTEAIKSNIENIPVWDRHLLEDVYEQLQSIRPYYNFTGVDVDRYIIDGKLQQVNLAAREINLDKLQGSGKNWINRHLQYTHGYGLVMTPAAQSGEEFMKWYIRGIPPSSTFGLDISEPGIYFGQENLDYVIAPNDAGEMDYPDGDSFATANYKGSTGIPVDSMFRKLLFSIYFKDRNIFFTTKTGNDSKILFRRNIGKAMEHLTPFFELDKDPYLVVTENGLFWFQDAYTRSDLYPNAEPWNNRDNYIRNSVKIVMDAYNGTIDYYLADPRDPVARAYSRMYPGLIKPLDEMPDSLRAHIRYPKDIFEIQMDIYTKYHQTDPKTFYREEDLWEFAHQKEKEVLEIGSGSLRSYYLTLDLIEQENPEFMLISPMSPKNRPNLRAMVIAGCDGDRYGKFYVYSFPKGEQVYGPSQISALIDQDTEIAEQFTLWDQVGSEVKRGRMIILPIADVVFYIQPVYMSASSELKIPQLRRLIVTQGDVVVMDVSLEKAFERLRKRMLENRKQDVQTPLPASSGPPENQNTKDSGTENI